MLQKTKLYDTNLEKVVSKWVVIQIICDTLEQTWATSGPRATYGPPST